MATQIARTMTLLTRSFENEAEKEIKAAFSEVSLKMLEIFKMNSTNLVVRDAIILYFHRMIIVMGSDLEIQLKDVINILSQNISDPTVVCMILKIETLALATWKDKAFHFVNELFQYMLNSVINIGLPINKVTDNDRSIIEAICQFERLLKTTILLDPLCVLALPLTDFCRLVEHLAKWANSPLDETLRKFALNVLVMLLGACFGLNVTSENSMTLLDQNIDNSKSSNLFNEKPTHVRALLQKTEEIAILTMQVVDPNQSAVDAQTYTDLAVIHILLSKTLGPAFSDKLNSIYPIDGDPGGIKKILDEATNSHTAKKYRDVVKHIMINKLKKV